MMIFVIGLGSMGKRRIRILGELYPSISICGIDSNPDRRKDCGEKYGIETYSGMEEALAAAKGDIAFICTSPLTHSTIITECLNNGLHVFSELNLVQDGYRRNIDLAAEMNRILFMSSTFLYREETKYITEKVRSCSSPLNYSYHIGQYLPDWHPWESFKDYFIGNKRTNGCREIFAIELPWISNAFGRITNVNTVSSKMTGLDIDYNDNYIVTITHETGHKGVVIADVVCRSPVRKFEVYGENLQIEWSGEPETLQLYDIEKKEFNRIETYKKIERLEGYSSQIIENEYADEIREFFAVVNGERKPFYTFEDDLSILDLIDRIERGV